MNGDADTLNLAAHLRYEHDWSWRRLNEAFKPTWWSVRSFRDAVEYAAEKMGYIAPAEDADEG